ncbi:hypothetical protein ACO0R3_003156 [Hanseniaspora guilliermondii]
MSVKNNRYLMAQLHDTKNIYIKNDIKGTYINSEENDDYMIGSFDGSSMLYICDSSILNSHLKNPAQYGIVYVPSRYLFIEIQTNNTAAVIFNQHEFKEMFENMGYKTMEIIVKPCNKNSTLIFQFECTMALYSNINNFQTEANASMSNKPTKFIEYSKLILEFEFQVSNPSASRSWIEKRVNSLCKEYINSLLVSILEVNYPLLQKPANNQSAYDIHIQNIELCQYCIHNNNDGYISGENREAAIIMTFLHSLIQLDPQYPVLFDNTIIETLQALPQKEPKEGNKPIVPNTHY